MAKSAKQIVRDLAQDVETAAAVVVTVVGHFLGECPSVVQESHAKYREAVDRLRRATGEEG